MGLLDCEESIGRVRNVGGWRARSGLGDFVSRGGWVFFDGERGQVFTRGWQVVGLVRLWGVDF